MISYRRGKTLAEKYAEQEEKRKAKQKNQGTRKPLTAAEQKKVEQLRQKVVEMSRAGRKNSQVETR